MSVGVVIISAKGRTITYKYARYIDQLHGGG